MEKIGFGGTLQDLRILSFQGEGVVELSFDDDGNERTGNVRCN
jgi:hypothetical protein